MVVEPDTLFVSPDNGPGLELSSAGKLEMELDRVGQFFLRSLSSICSCPASLNSMPLKKCLWEEYQHVLRNHSDQILS